MKKFVCFVLLASAISALGFTLNKQETHVEMESVAYAQTYDPLSPGYHLYFTETQNGTTVAY